MENGAGWTVLYVIKTWFSHHVGGQINEGLVLFAKLKFQLAMVDMEQPTQISPEFLGIGDGTSNLVAGVDEWRTASAAQQWRALFVK